MLWLYADNTEYDCFKTVGMVLVLVLCVICGKKQMSNHVVVHFCYPWYP